MRGKFKDRRLRKETNQGKKKRVIVSEAELKDLEARILLECPPPGHISTLDHQQQKPDSSEGLSQSPSLTATLFTDLPLSSRTQRGLKASRFIRLTPIQALSIPHSLAGRDIMGEAETGSGKTLAYLVPVRSCCIASFVNVMCFSCIQTFQ